MPIKDRFDLESDIMSAWNVTEDMQLVIEKIDELAIQDEQTDKLFALVVGLKELYNIKFERLWDTFEECIQNREFDDYKEKYENNETTESPWTNNVQETGEGSLENDWNIYSDSVTGVSSDSITSDTITVTLPQQSELNFDFDYGNKDDFVKYTI